VENGIWAPAMDRVPYLLPMVLYGVLSFVHLLPGVWPAVEQRARAIGIVAVALHVLALALQLAFETSPPGYPEALSAASLGVMAAYALTAEGRLRSLGMLLSPLGLVLLGTSLVVPHRQVAALADAGPSPWLPVHLGLMFAGLAGFALSFAVGVAYLLVRWRLKHRKFDMLGRLPPLEMLDRLQFRSTLFGFVFLTLGIGAGGVWAAAAMKEPWFFDPKVLFTLVIWLWYGIALQVRLVAGMRGRWSALFSIVGFAGLIFSMVALNFLVSGWHGYAG
jgi:ABC-type transport system involved in cytochrome c biogenesis permease subunit